MATLIMTIDSDAEDVKEQEMRDADIIMEEPNKDAMVFEED